MAETMIASHVKSEHSTRKVSLFTHVRNLSTVGNTQLQVFVVVDWMYGILQITSIIWVN